MTKPHIPKDYQPLADRARNQGWTIEPTKGGHLRWRSPDGQSVFSPSTPSDRRGLLNVVRKLKHKGFKA